MGSTCRRPTVCCRGAGNRSIWPRWWPRQPCGSRGKVRGVESAGWSSPYGRNWSSSCGRSSVTRTTRSSSTDHGCLQAGRRGPLRKRTHRAFCRRPDPILCQQTEGGFLAVTTKLSAHPGHAPRSPNGRGCRAVSSCRRDRADRVDTTKEPANRCVQHGPRRRCPAAGVRGGEPARPESLSARAATKYSKSEP